MWNKRPPQTGIYRIEDDIGSLRIRVRLQAVTSPLVLPRYMIKAQRRSATWSLCLPEDDKSLPSAEGTTNVLADLIIRWQQKLLNPQEMNLYKDPKNCRTSIQGLYHSYLKEIQWQSSKVRRDGLPGRKKTTTRHKKDEKSEPKLRRWKKDYVIGIGDRIYTYINADDHRPESDAVKGQGMLKYAEENVEKMFIYGFLDQDILLATLSWFPRQRQLHVYPDFMDIRDDYHLIEIQSDYRQLYTFAMENISPRNEEKLRKQRECLKLPEDPYGLSRARSMLLQSNVILNFSMPPKRMKRCLLLFELMDMFDFEYDNCHVRYTIQPPLHTIREDGELEGITHSVRYGYGPAINSMNIGYCWQLLLLCEQLYDVNRNLQEVEPLRVYFEVISIDSWCRERVEGYGYFNIHLTRPSTGQLTIYCMRPSDTLWDKLNRYFIGGRKKFDYITFFQGQRSTIELQNRDTEREKRTQRRKTERSPRSPLDSIANDAAVQILHSHYGQRCQFTGRLNLKYQLIIQSVPDILHDHNASTESGSSRRRKAKGATTRLTMDSVLNSYREARKRLENVTANKTKAE